MAPSHEVIPHIWVPLPDGARLAARVWRPTTTHEIATPAILEYIPYRKDDGTVARDETTHPHLADHGFTCIRVDMRGSGSSDGVLLDEYSDQEMADGESVIRWIADQPWCNGKVGMIGISWGGITGLQMAARRADGLEAVIALGATDSRYYDDGGYYVGCMVGETVGWASIMLSYNTRPPDPQHRPDDWRELWVERLRDAPLLLGLWLDHQREDDYWMRGTVASDHSRIRIPVLAVSGHADCWPNAVPRLVANLNGVVHGIQGQWSHRYPQMAIPGPTVDFLPEVVTWFDHWLRDASTGDLSLPALRFFVQESVRPSTFHAERPGRWIAFEEWPSPLVTPRTFHLCRGELALHADPVAAPRVVSSPQTVGLDGGEYMPWFSFGIGPELPADQTGEDLGSCCFDTAPLDDPLTIVGESVLELDLASSRPQALVAARLCDVAPDGTSTLITRGVVNLSQRESKTHPEPVVPGESVSVTISLNHVGYELPPGHRLRLGVSSSYWPIAWPAPRPVELTLLSSSRLHVPTVGDLTPMTSPRPAPEQPSSEAYEPVAPHHERRRREVDDVTGTHSLIIETDNGSTRFHATGTEVASTSVQRYDIHPDDPLSAKAYYSWTWSARRDDWHVATTAETTMTCTADTFDVEAEITASEDGVRFFDRSWSQRHPRDHF